MQSLWVSIPSKNGDYLLGIGWIMGGTKKLGRDYWRLFKLFKEPSKKKVWLLGGWKGLTFWQVGNQLTLDLGPFQTKNPFFRILFLF